VVACIIVTKEKGDNELEISVKFLCLCFNFLNGEIDVVSSNLHCFLCSQLHNLCNLVTLFTFFLCLIFAYKYGTYV
jgi:hypothetical protein